MTGNARRRGFSLSQGSIRTFAANTTKDVEQRRRRLKGIAKVETIRIRTKSSAACSARDDMVRLAGADGVEADLSDNPECRQFDLTVQGGACSVAKWEAISQGACDCRRHVRALGNRTAPPRRSVRENPLVAARPLSPPRFPPRTDADYRGAIAPGRKYQPESRTRSRPSTPLTPRISATRVTWRCRWREASGSSPVWTPASTRRNTRASPRATPMW